MLDARSTHGSRWRIHLGCTSDRYSGSGGQFKLPGDVTRSLYFENPIQHRQPITAEYSLQAGTLPTSTDPFGWHWSASQGDLVQATAMNIPVSQHEAYLGFVSGVLFGVVGGAVVLVLQELAPACTRTASIPRLRPSFLHARQTNKAQIKYCVR